MMEPKSDHKVTKMEPESDQLLPKFESKLKEQNIKKLKQN